MNRYIKVASLDEFVTRASKRVVIEDADVALFCIKGQFYAVQNDCPHQHYSNMHEGILNGLELTCPMHGWTFNLSTGQAVVGGGRLRRYAVKIVGNDILVEASHSEPDWAQL